MNYYSSYYERLLDGFASKPRGMPIRYRRNVAFEFYPGNIVRRPGDNVAIGLMEMLQFIGGVFDIHSFEVCAPRARLNLFTPQMAYGPRTVGQFQGVIEELHNDPDSRRAEIIIARGNDKPNERPCTIAAQFQLEHYFDPQESYLSSTFYMRSSDAVWGLPNDIIQFGGVTLAIANCLQVPPQPSAVLIGNAHVYNATTVDPSTFDVNWTFNLPVFDDWNNYVEWSRDIISSYPTREELLKIFNVS